LIVPFVVVFAVILGTRWSFATSAQARPDATRKSAKGGKVADSELQQCIEKGISASELKVQRVEVSVKDGDVVITGAFKTPAQHSAAEQIAKRCGASRIIVRKRL